MTRREAIKPEDIEVTYSKSSNMSDIIIKGSLQQATQIRGCLPCGKQWKTCEHIMLPNVGEAEKHSQY